MQILSPVWKGGAVIYRYGTVYTVPVYRECVENKDDDPDVSKMRDRDSLTDSKMKPALWTRKFIIYIDSRGVMQVGLWVRKFPAEFFRKFPGK